MSQLFDAIRSGDAAAVESIVDGDPAEALTRENNVSAILTALYHGRNEIARLLVDRGAAVDFHEAAALGDLERVTAMLTDDPSLLDRKSADGFPAVGLAIFFRHPAVAKFLIEKGADVDAVAENAQRVAPLHAAAAVRDMEMTRLLLARGANPNVKQQMDYTPLHSTASHGDIEMAKLLIASGADVTAKSSDGMTAAEIAMKYNQPAFAEWFAKESRH